MTSSAGERCPSQVPGIGDWQELSARFSVAGPELAVDRELRCRADTKFVLPRSAARKLIGALTGDYLAMRAGEGIIASYRTLYFDTAELEFFHSHRRGRRVRHKARVRHYPDRCLTSLEVKTRLGEQHTTKVWRAREYGDNELRADDQAFIATQTGVARRLLPQVWTDFRRLTLLGAEANERITVDLDLAFTMGADPGWRSDVAIVEVKQWPFSRATPVMRALRLGGWRPTGGSKYCAAIALTRPEVSHARFIPELRALGAHRMAA